MTEGLEKRREAAQEMITLSIGNLIDFLPDATMMVDLQGSVVVWNRAMEVLTTIPRAAMIGQGDHHYGIAFYGERRPVLLDFILDPQRDPGSLYPAVQREGDTLIAEMTVYHPQGVRRCLWAKASPVRNDRGETIGAIETVRDITEIRRTQESLREREVKYRRIFENIQDVYYEVSLDGILLEISPSIRSLLDYDPAELLGASVLGLYADPEQRQGFLRLIVERGYVHDYEILLKLRNGETIPVAFNTRLVREAGDGSPRIVGSMRSVKHRREMENALRLSEERYRSLIRNLPVAIDRTTPEPDGKILMANPAFLEMFGFQSEGEVKGIDPRSLYMDPRERELYSRKLLAEGTLSGYEIRFRRADGTPVWGAVTGRVVHEGEGGEQTYFDCIIEDITERKKQEETIWRLAYYDVLTGLPNRTLFRDRLDMAIRRADREREKVVLMMLDLDRFKSVNDNLGHPVGDQLLKEMADRMRRHLRKSDTIARLSGDEFMVVYAGVRQPEQALAMARKLLRTFEEPFAGSGHALRVTASVGVAVYPDDAADIDMLLRNVDIALYQAKNDGRDNCRRYTGREKLPGTVQ